MEIIRGILIGNFRNMNGTNSIIFRTFHFLLVRINGYDAYLSFFLQPMTQLIEVSSNTVLCSPASIIEQIVVFHKTNILVFLFDGCSQLYFNVPITITGLSSNFKSKPNGFTPVASTPSMY